MSHKGTPKVELLTSPKYHCELAGEGVEYTWGMMKKYYRSLLLEMKNTKRKFEACVSASVLHVKRENVARFSAKCRRYMMAYHECDHQDEDSPKPKTYQEIERFVKKSKCHKNVSDQDAGYLARI